MNDRNRDMIWVFLLFLLEGLWEADGVSVKGNVGGEIQITCSHTYASTNVKYFCKGACGYEDVLVTSQKKQDTNPKYSIDDKGNTFYVWITDLKLEDSGTYWCGVERTGIDTYTEVILKVVEGSSDDDANVSHSKRLVYIGAGLGVVVLALGIALLIFFRHRKRGNRALFGKDHGIVDETPPIQKENTRSSITKDPQTDDIHLSLAEQPDTSGDHLKEIYSNVSSAAPVEENNLFYSTICFSNQTDCSPVTPPAAPCIYSSLKHIQTASSEL